MARPKIPWYRKIRLEVNGCWTWLGQIGTKGYPKETTWDGEKTKHHLAHRYVYQQMKGEIPDKHQIHHTCGNRACVNPWHMEPLTSLQHNRKHAKMITHCPQGHEYTEENTYVHNNQRYCKQCRSHYRRISDRKRRERIKNGA